MIRRYEDGVISQIWRGHHRMALWTRIELAVLRKRLTKEGLWLWVGPRPWPAWGDVTPEPCLVEKRERECGHEVEAFLEELQKNLRGWMAGKALRFLHDGLTSSDLVDTANAVCIDHSVDRVEDLAAGCLNEIEPHIRTHARTRCAGRTHGMHAAATTVGKKMSSWFGMIWRVRLDLASLGNGTSVGKLSGPVGTNDGVSPEDEEDILEQFGLRREKFATQIVPRDRYARVFNTLALLGSVLEAIALEIRLLHRSEVDEIREGCGPNKVGSTSIPQKMNPTRCERICGLSRVLRSYAQVGLENVPTWHERDLSHSSAERLILPSAFHTAAFMLSELRDVIRGLSVNVNAARGKVLSDTRFYAHRVQRVLIQHGWTRNEARSKIRSAFELEGSGTYNMDPTRLAEKVSSGETDPVARGALEKAVYAAASPGGDDVEDRVEEILERAGFPVPERKETP